VVLVVQELLLSLVVPVVRLDLVGRVVVL